MRALGLTDTIFGNLRDAQITAVAALDGPCDLPRLLAGVEGVVAALPGFAETHVRLGVWSFARPPQPVDVTRHVSVARDPTVTRVEDLAPLLDRLRRSRLRVAAGPQWRLIVLNPGAPLAHPPPLSAVFMQIRHGLADGTRIVQAIARLDALAPTAAHVAVVAQLAAVSFEEMAEDIPVHDAGLITMQVPRRDMPREDDAGARFAGAVAAAVEDARLFPHARPLRGNLGRTRLLARRAGSGGAGNFIRMETIVRNREAGRRRFAIPGLSRAHDLPLSQWVVAIAPPPLARLMMRIWYGSFDCVATLIPLPRRLRLGGRRVSAFFAAPPLWGPVPLMALALADGEHYHVTLFPGRPFAAADRGALATAFRAALTRRTAEPAASPAA
jgi:hypothetical protein